MTAANRSTPARSTRALRRSASRSMASRTQPHHGGASNYDSTTRKTIMVATNTSVDMMGRSSEDGKLLDVESKTREESCETVSQGDSSGQQLREISTGASHDVQRNTLPTCSSQYPQSIANIGTSATSIMDPERQFLNEICIWIQQIVPDQRGARMAECFVGTIITPPITKSSLSELDIVSIVSNPKLRHDVNFDRELHFRPNHEGSRGRQKMKAAEDYWLALEAELELYKHVLHCTASLQWDHDYYKRLVKATQRRIPTMFRCVREILINLLPDRDHCTVEDNLDEQMLMQEIERGVCDLTSIARWLSQLLKRHCAPMRDEWLEKMVEQIALGVSTASARHMVTGLKELFGILEAMKLDVANHQVRHLRTILIEDTYNFETKYHQDRIERRRIDVEKVQAWFHHTEVIPRTLPKMIDQTKLAHLVSGFLQLLLTRSRDPIPDTFSLDADRIRSLRSDLSDMVHMDICTRVFDLLLQRLRVINGPSDSARLALHMDLLAIVSEGSDAKRGWVNNVENIALEIVRHALRIAHQMKAYDMELVHSTELVLREAFQQTQYNTYQMINYPAIASRLQSLLYPRVMDAVEAQLNASPVDIFNTFISFIPPPPPPPPPPPTSSIRTITGTSSQQRPAPPFPQTRPDPLADVTRRIAHIAVLHWRIWSPIVYSSPKAVSQMTNQQQQQGQITVRANSEPIIATVDTTGTGTASSLEQRTALVSQAAAAQGQQQAQQQPQQPVSDCETGVSELRLPFHQRPTAPG